MVSPCGRPAPPYSAGPPPGPIVITAKAKGFSADIAKAVQAKAANAPASPAEGTTTALRRSAAAAGARLLNKLINADNRIPVVEDDGDKDYEDNRAVKDEETTKDKEAAEDKKARPAGATA